MRRWPESPLRQAGFRRREALELEGMVSGGGPGPEASPMALRQCHSFKKPENISKDFSICILYIFWSGAHCRSRAGGEFAGGCGGTDLNGIGMDSRPEAGRRFLKSFFTSGNGRAWIGGTRRGHEVR